MTCTAGIDVGSSYTKAVIINAQRKVIGSEMLRTGFNFPLAAEKALAGALEQAGVKREELVYLASTGYGRSMVPFRDIQITELTSHAKGTHHFFPGTRTLLDVGGQTLKAIRIDERAKVKSFRLNDKCAAGTGAFLEKTARYMGYEVHDIGALARRSEEPVSVSSVCAVFAESEVINHLSSGKKPEDIMNGAIISLAGRAAQLMKRVRLEPEFACVGGMTRLEAFAEALQEALKAPVQVPAGGMGSFTGALGAALLGLERYQKLQAQAAAQGATA